MALRLRDNPQLACWDEFVHCDDIDSWDLDLYEGNDGLILIRIQITGSAELVIFYII